MNGKPKTALKAIRAYCLYCGNGSANEVRLCDITRCPLHEWRFGKNPNLAGKKITEERRRAFIQNVRGAKKNIEFSREENRQEQVLEHVYE